MDVADEVCLFAFLVDKKRIYLFAQLRIVVCEVEVLLTSLLGVGVQKKEIRVGDLQLPGRMGLQSLLTSKALNPSLRIVRTVR